MNNIAIVGVGNPFRGDDGAGCAVIDVLSEKMPPSITLRKTNGDIAELLDLFTQYATVYIIDACQGDGLPGSWQRINALTDNIPLDAKQTSTHGLNVSQAIQLATHLKQLPSQLIIYTIASDNFTIQTSVSWPVSQAISKVAQAIEKDIQKCMKKA